MTEVRLTRPMGRGDVREVAIMLETALNQAGVSVGEDFIVKPAPTARQRRIKAKPKGPEPRKQPPPPPNPAEDGLF